MIAFQNSEASILGTLSLQNQHCQRPAPLTLMIAFQFWCIHYGKPKVEKPNL